MSAALFLGICFFFLVLYRPLKQYITGVPKSWDAIILWLFVFAIGTHLVVKFYH